jgi:hypothetical protein
MKIRLASALVAALIAGVPAPAFATPTFDFFTLSVGGVPLTPSANFAPQTSTDGTTVTKNIGSPTAPFTSYSGAGYTFTIGPGTSIGSPNIFAVDQALDQATLTNSLIKLVSAPANTPLLPLVIDFAFDFPLPANTQTYGYQDSGKFGRLFTSATGDSATIETKAVFTCCAPEPVSDAATVMPNASVPAVPSGPASNNNFGPLQAKQSISCSSTLDLDGSCPIGSSYELEVLATINFTKVGDSITVFNGFDAVSGVDPDDVQDRLDDLAAADAAALAVVPEPNTVVLLLGSGLAWLGLSRLKHVRGRAGRDRCN